MATQLPLTESPDGVTFAVRVVPRAGRSGVAGVRDGALVVRVAAAPVDSAANETLVAFLAEALDRPKRAITILTGRKSRHKRVVVQGVTRAQLEAQLSAILPA